MEGRKILGLGSFQFKLQVGRYLTHQLGTFSIPGNILQQIPHLGRYLSYHTVPVHIFCSGKGIFALNQSEFRGTVTVLVPTFLAPCVGYLPTGVMYGTVGRYRIIPTHLDVFHRW